MSSFRAHNAVIMGQPRCLRCKYKSSVGIHASVFRQLLKKAEIVEHPERAPVGRRNDLSLACIDSDVAHLRDRKI